MDKIFDRTFEHKEKLMAAALEEFSLHGYEQASLNNILQTAGMSKGQFYYHFGSKEDLYFALITAVIQRKQAFLAKELEDQDRQGDIFDILLEQLTAGLTFSRLYPEINRFADSFMREKGTPIYDKALEKFNLGSGDFLERMVQKAIENGELRQDIPQSFISNAIGYLFTHAVEVASLSEVETAQENLDYLVAFLRSGFGKHSSYTQEG
jgi:AcrR family transcriptional regulator